MAGIEKLQCMSYAPFRGEQSPLGNGTHISAAQIEDDLKRLKPLTDCIRTYSIEHGLDQVPDIARRLGMTVIQGLWLSSNAAKNRDQVDTVVALANRHPDVIQSVIVGNEVLLRGELSAPDVLRFLREVKAQVPMPVTYADVWEFWLRHRELLDAVDFVTIHILPYWEDHPIPAEQAAAHVASIRERMAQAFPGKELLIGETGWPSQGRMREGALPSQVNQALVIQEILAAAKERGYRVNVIEAFDQPWKRRLEGTVGGFWGMLDDANRAPKFEWGAPVSNHPEWRWQALLGLALGATVFAAAAGARMLSAGSMQAPLSLWVATAIFAATGGAMIGLAIERMAYESLGAGGWIRSLAMLAVAACMPVAAGAAVMTRSGIAGFADVLAGDRRKAWPSLALVMGALTVAAAILTLHVALGLVFDPRYRDFPYAPLTAAILPLAIAMMLNPVRASNARAEWMAAAILAGSAVYIVFNEGVANWQSLWFCALALLLAITLLRPGAGRAAPG